MTDRLNVMTTTNAGRGSSPAGVGFYRVRKSPRTTGPALPLGRSGKVEKLIVGSLATEQRSDAGNRLVETEEETRIYGKWSESGHRTATNTNFNITLSKSDGGGSHSNPQRGGPVLNDRFEGMYFDRIQPKGCFGLLDAVLIRRNLLFYRSGLRDRGMWFCARSQRSRRERS